MQKRNCITALICAAIFAFFLIQSQMLSDTAAYWPTIICSVGLALSCLEILLEGIKWRRTADHQEKFFLPGKPLVQSRQIAANAVLADNEQVIIRADVNGSAVTAGTGDDPVAEAGDVGNHLGICVLLEGLRRLVQQHLPVGNPQNLFVLVDSIVQ